MKTLVLCVDRDDDMGEKAHVISPIIGREENLNAAVALALVDPEDSDVNTTLAGIKLYDNLINRGRDAEIATICGDKSLKKRSDEVIATQLDIVIKEIEPTGVILVSDGAEDEYIVPVVSSRIPIDSLERVVVKQRKSIEDTYYLITRLMNDDKIQRKFLLPIAVLLLFWAITSLLTASTNFPDIGVPTILLIIGGYLIVRIYNLEESIVRFARDFKAGIEKGYISTLTGMISAILVVFGLLQSAVELGNNPQFTLSQSTVFLLANSWWFIVGAGMFYTFGRLIDIYVRKGYIVRSIVFSLFLIMSGGLILLAVVYILEYFLDLSQQPDLMSVFLLCVAGLFVFLVGKRLSSTSGRHLKKTLRTG